MANEEKDGDQNSGGRGYAWQDQTPGQQSSGPRSQQRGRLQDSYASRGQQGRQDGEGQWNKNRQGYGNNNNSNSRPQNHSNAFHHRRAPRFENRDNNASAPGNSRDTTNYSGPPGGTTHLQEPVQVMRRGYAEAARSVTRAEEAPGAREEAPGAREEAPGAREEAPGAREEAPGAWGGAWGGAPGARDEAPGAREEAPGAWEEALVAREEAPGAREEAPGAREEAPGAQEEATGSLEEATGAVPKPREEPAKERDAVKGYKDGGRRPRPAEIKEVEGDLFQAPNEHSLAHCVAEDFRMGSGIAVTFSSKFQSVGELLSQRKTVGEVAVLEVKQRYVYYLVTKRLSNGKPTLEDLRRSVVEMRRHCVEHAVTQLALPRIGCGLDRLSWYDVKRMLGEVFTGSGVAITVYNFPQAEDQIDLNLSKRKSSLWISHHKMSLVDIAAKTGLLYLCCEDPAEVTPAMRSLDAKHRFLHQFRLERKPCGEVVRTPRGNDLLYGLVVRKTGGDPVSYVHLVSCLRRLRKLNEKDFFDYFGVEACRDGEDALTMEKVVTAFKSVLGSVSYKLEVWVCWPKEFEADHTWEEVRETKRAGW